MGLAAWYAFALTAIDLTYDPATRQLLEYQGIGVIRDSHGRNQSVRIEFPARARISDAAPDGVRRAAALALSGQCAG
jgi:hypothetical protein